MFFFVITLFIGASTASNNDNSMQNGITCWAGIGFAFGEKGVFGTFTKEKCSPETKSCFSSSFLTVHGEIFAHHKGCADANGCSLYGKANFGQLRGIAKLTDCRLCFKSGCNKPETVTMDIQLGEIECVSEVMAKLVHSYGNGKSTNGGEENKAPNQWTTLKLAPKSIRCSAHSNWCVSAKCVPTNPQKSGESSIFLFKGCAMSKMTKKVMDQLCAETINGEMEFFRFLPGTAIGHETEGHNGSTKSVSFDFN